MVNKKLTNNFASIRVIIDPQIYLEARRKARELGFGTFSEWIRSKIRSDLLTSNEGDKNAKQNI